MFLANFVPLIVGSIFFAVGISFIVHFMRFRARSKTVRGRVVAIEKYIGTSGNISDGGQARTLYYRPVVEYIYNGQTQRTVGLSVNEIRHKLDQRLQVMLNISNDGAKIQAIVVDRLNVFIGSIFSLVGGIAIGVYVFGLGGSIIATLIVCSVMIIIGGIISHAILNHSDHFKGDENGWQKKENSTVIETRADYLKEISSAGFWGKIIAFTLMFASFGIMYAGYKDIPLSVRALIFNDFEGFGQKLTDGTFSSNVESALMVFGIGSFFFLASLRSIYYVTKKYGGLMRV